MGEGMGMRQGLATLSSPKATEQRMCLHGYNVFTQAGHKDACIIRITYSHPLSSRARLKAGIRS